MDFAMDKYGGPRESWLDLSTGINPKPYNIARIEVSTLYPLPTSTMLTELENTARRFWNVPENASIIATHGASAAIAAIPFLLEGQNVNIPQPTYNEHRAAFENAGWNITSQIGKTIDAQVLVHPNNPTGHLYSEHEFPATHTIIDESFCDVCPSESFIDKTAINNIILIKSFGKFWGLAGVRLGFVVGSHELMSRLRKTLGPWPVSTQAMEIGKAALCDFTWAKKTRARLAQDSERLDALFIKHGARFLGGCSLFRTYRVSSAENWQHSLAQHHIWSRIFPYSSQMIRLGLPPASRWEQLEHALESQFP